MLKIINIFIDLLKAIGRSLYPPPYPSQGYATLLFYACVWIVANKFLLCGAIVSTRFISLMSLWASPFVSLFFFLAVVTGFFASAVAKSATIAVNKLLFFNFQLVASNDSLYAGNDFFQYLACVDVLPVSILNMLNSLVVSFIMSAIVLHVTKERLNGSKGLQLLTGCHPFTYWLSNYIFDMAICLFNVSDLNKGVPSRAG